MTRKIVTLALTLALTNGIASSISAAQTSKAKDGPFDCGPAHCLVSSNLHANSTPSKNNPIKSVHQDGPFDCGPAGCLI